MRWHETTVTVVLDGSLGDLARDASESVSNAIDTWMENAKVPDVQIDVSSERGKAKRDGVNRIVAGPIDIPGHENDLALTMTYVDQDTGAIVESDMIINTKHRWNRIQPSRTEQVVEPDTRPGSSSKARGREKALLHTTACGQRFDVQNVVTHELGHFFGLGEDVHDTEASMYYKSRPCETKKRSLSSDDLSVMNALYEHPIADEQDDGAVGCSAVPSSKRSLGSWPWLMALLATLTLARRRR